MLLAGGVARADCTPASANNVTATCTSTTTNQGGGAPGSNAGTDGYGTGTETGVTVTVTNGATVSGITSGIFLDTATVINNAGGSITGAQMGVSANTSVVVTNSGSISGNGYAAINVNNTAAAVTATVTNNVGGIISSSNEAAVQGQGSIDVINFGSVTGAFGVSAGADAFVTNHSGGVITALIYAVIGNGGIASVTNSGSIVSTAGVAIFAATNATVTNNTGASIAGSTYGIRGLTYVDVTNSGSITSSGYGIWARTSGSSVFNAGTISGTTAAIQFAVGGNTLTLAPGSVITGNVLGAGADTFQLGGVGPATFDISKLASAGQYRGFGTFNKIGSSIWTLTGTSSFTGPVNVNDGTLSVNGNIASASAVTVNAGATLGGNGTVRNATINAGGALAPGNSIGLLTVQGSLSFAAASSYMIEVSPGNADRTNVTGTANLGGATVRTSFAAGSYVARQYNILNATGGLGGSTFGSMVTTSLPSGFHSSLSYDNNNAYLDLALNFVAPPNSGLSGNQQGVGNALVNFFNSNGGIPLVFGGLTAAGLSQVSGETATGSQQTTFNAMTQFFGVMTDPFGPGRGEGGAGAPAFAQESDAFDAYAATGRKRSGAERDAYGMMTKATPRAPLFEARWNVWAAGFGGSQTTDGNTVAGSNSSTSRIYGVAAGADYWLSPQTVAGFALAGGGTNFNVTNGGSGRSDLFQAGGFVRHNAGAAYITAAAAYGWQDITTDRTVTIAGIDRLRAQFNTNAWSGRVEGGYRFITQGVGLTPYAAGQFTTFDLPAYAETVVSGANTFALGFAGKTVTATRSELGLRTDKSFAMQDAAILTLRGRFAWAHDFNTDCNIAATFQTLPGAGFVVDGAAAAHDAALTTASAEMKWLNGFSLAGTFEGEFSNVTRSYAGKGVARYQW
jgi:uncharacterized protein with beta-barrel porin domain